MAFINWAEALLNHTIMWSSKLLTWKGKLASSFLIFPHRERGIRSWELASWIGGSVEGAGHGVAPPFGSTGAVDSREALGAPRHAPHTARLGMCTGLPLQLEQDAKSIIVCLWVDSTCCLLANADTQCLNGGSVECALASPSPPISCFLSDEIWNSLSGAIGVRWDEKSHLAQLGNLHFRIPIRIINQQLFRL